MTRITTEFDKWIVEHKSDPDFATAKVLLDITAQISAELERQGKTRSDLAKLLKVDRAQVSRILNGHPNMTVKTIVKVALALGLKLEMRLLTGYGLPVDVSSAHDAQPHGEFVAERSR